MKKTLSKIFAATLLLSPLAASAMENIPKYCPDVNVVKQAKFNRAYVDYWVGWIASAPNSNYQTQQEWTLASMVGSPKKITEAEAVDRANSFLSLVNVGNSIPEQNSHAWWCYYADNIDEPQAVVYMFTPAMEDLGQKLQKFRKTLAR